MSNAIVLKLKTQKITQESFDDRGEIVMGPITRRQFVFGGTH